MMAYQKRYKPPPVPVPKDEPYDDAQVVWFAREFMERAATSDALRLTRFTDLGEIPAEDIPPKVDKQLGRPATDFVWRAFEGVGERA